MEFPILLLKGCSLVGLLHCRSHLQLSCKPVYKSGSDFFILQLTGLGEHSMWLKHRVRAGWQCNGSSTPGVRATCSSNLHLLKPSLKYTTWFRSVIGHAWLYGLVDQTQFMWGSWCSTVKWRFSLYHSPLASQEFSLKMRIITVQNRHDFAQNPYEPLLWISYQGFHRIHTASLSVTGILQTIGLTDHKWSSIIQTRTVLRVKVDTSNKHIGITGIN